MKYHKNSRPVIIYLLFAALLFQGLSGLAGGLMLIIDPSGSLLNLPLQWLRYSPFSDYLIPGIILFSILGLLPLVVAYGLWSEKSWGWITALLISLALLIWIGVEVVIIGYQADPPLQAIYGILGIIMLVLTLTPSIRLYLKADHH